jgi:nucleotide-binding universal stress UspA family protein
MSPTIGGQILVAVDGTPFGTPALPLAQAVARLTGQKLRLLGVVKQISGYRSALATSYARRREHESHQRLETYLAQTEARVRRQGFEVSSVLLHGDPTNLILLEAGRPDVGMVALSTEGRGGISRWAAGSVADKVMRLSSVPTLIARRPYVPYVEREVTLRRILLPLDGSSLAEQAVALIPPFLSESIELIAVRVEPWLTDASAPLGTVEEFMETERAAEHDAERYLADAVRRIPELKEASRLVLRGETADTLAGFALHEHIDLVVMTTHGTGGLQRLLVGSTADSLIRAGIPTLLMRPESAPEKEE